MIGRVHERRAFQQLTRDGRRARTENLWCRYVDDSHATPPRVAFAIGRHVGPAVVRNRLRRRLRVLSAQLATSPDPSSPALLPHGVLLIGAQPRAVERSFEELRVELTMLITRVRSSVADPARS